MQAYALRSKRNILSYNRIILIFLAVFFLIRLIYMQRIHIPIWDEAVYIGMGKYLYSLGHVGLWEMFRPVMMPLLLGLGYIFGSNEMVFGEILVIFFSTAVLYLVYAIGKNLFDKRIGALATFFTAITPVFFLYSGYILTEIPSLFFVLCAVYCLTKERVGKKEYIFSGLFAAFAFLTKYPQGLLFISLTAYFSIRFLFNRTKRNSSPLFYIPLAFILTQLPFFAFNLLLYRHETSKVWHAMFRPIILAASHQYNPAEFVGQKFFYIIHLSQQNFWLLFIIIGAVFYLTTKSYKKPGINLLATVFLAYFAYFNWIPNKQLRFSITFLPFICIFAGYGIFELVNRITKNGTHPNMEKIILATVCLLSLVLIIQADANYYLWRPATNPDIVAEFYEYFKDITTKENPARILTSDPVPAAYVDAYFMPIYFSLPIAYATYENSSYDYIIYSTDTYYCAPEDEKCREQVSYFSKLISSENELTFTKKYKTRTYYIYKKRLAEFN